MSRQRIELAISRMEAVRRNTERQLADLPPELWFWLPAEGVTHIAWQVAHIAFAEYSLCMRRQRGALPSDEAIISAEFLKCYGRESIPQPRPEDNFPLAEIRATFDRVRSNALAELQRYTDAELDVPTNPPHPIFTTKLGAVEWCGIHEMNHGGQITLLRRLQGNKPSW